MKTMVNKYGSKVNVVEHLLLSNGWEYYVTTDKYDDDIIRCVVMGFEVEMGDVYMPEIEPYIVTKLKLNKNSELCPAKGWYWENEN